LVHVTWYEVGERTRTLNRFVFVRWGNRRRLATRSCKASPGTTLEPPTSRVLDHLSTGVYEGYEVWWERIQSVVVEFRQSRSSAAWIVSQTVVLTMRQPSQVLYGVAKFSDRPELLLPEIDGGRGFLSRAMSLLGESLLQPDVTVVQALLLLCNSLGAQGAAANGPVLYLRIGEKRRRAWA